MGAYGLYHMHANKAESQLLNVLTCILALVHRAGDMSITTDTIVVLLGRAHIARNGC